VPELVSDPPQAAELDTQNIWDNLLSAGFSIPADVTFSDFCTADSTVTVNETLSDVAIIQAVTTMKQAANMSQAEEENDDNDDDVDDSSERRPVSTADAMNALSILRDWLECNTAGKHSVFDTVAELENFILTSRPMQQTSITDFFSRT